MWFISLIDIFLYSSIYLFLWKCASLMLSQIHVLQAHINELTRVAKTSQIAEWGYLLHVPPPLPSLASSCHRTPSEHAPRPCVLRLSLLPVWCPPREESGQTASAPETSARGNTKDCHYRITPSLYLNLNKLWSISIIYFLLWLKTVNEWINK